MLDVAQAVNLLPNLPSIGIAGKVGSRIASGIAPTPCKLGQTATNSGNDRTGIELSAASDVIVGSAFPVKAKGPLTILVNEPFEMGATGLEPVTPSVS